MELWHAVRAGDRQRIGVIQERLAPLAALRAKPGRSIPVVKEGLRLLGVFPSSACRPPLAAPDRRGERSGGSDAQGVGGVATATHSDGVTVTSARKPCSANSASSSALP